MPGKSGTGFRLLLEQGLAKLDIEVDVEAVSRLEEYFLELEKWSRKVNLIARNTSSADIIEKHFLDSLTLVPVLDRCLTTKASMLDVGSGAGFPGLVLKAARPEWDVTLLEPRERRVAFLRHIIRKLHLEEVSVVQARIEEGLLPEKHYFIITGRAVADIERFLAMVAETADQDSLVVCMQGEAGRQDIQDGSRVGGFLCREIINTCLPFSGNRRFLLFFEKLF